MHNTYLKFIRKELKSMNDSDPIIIDETESGEIVSITRNGKPVKLKKRAHPNMDNRKRFIMGVR